MTNIAPLVAAVILVTPPPQATNAVLLSLDKNRDGSIAQAELLEVVNKVILPFDDDQDSALEPPELHHLIFHLCDESDNLAVDGDEFGCVAQLIPGWVRSDLERLHTDMDGTLGSSEFVGSDPPQISQVWDSDRSGTINATEIGDRLVAAFDADGNEALDADELKSLPIVWPVDATALTSISSR
jgi:hypothetical protein